MDLKGKRVAVLAENMYQELELWYPLLRLREAGAEAFVVGSGSADSYKSKLGYPVQVDMVADQIGGRAPGQKGDLLLCHQGRRGQRWGRVHRR
jgi:putative intracellular protease/amidase